TVPPHLREVKFGLNHSAWQPEDIDRLAELLTKYSDRFSESPVDLGYCDTIPFRIELKPGTRPVKQRAYRRNPAINAKLQVEIDKMVLAGILRRSNSEWASPVVCVMKKNGSVRV
ncbi:unnamed protein product, partial [Ectocarpus sp. 8 AP-2014]